ncbi:MAG: OmpA family protein [Alphaproteobacteria bacterium]
MLLRRFALLGLVFILAACSSSREEVIDVVNELPDTVDLTVGDAASLADPSVEVFPIDGFVPAPVSGREAITETVIDNSVEVTPIEDVPVAVKEVDQEAVVLFEHSSTRLDSSDMDVVRRVAAGYTGGALEVKGHASVDSAIVDPIARKISNLKVSVARAVSVAKALASNGVSPDVITVSGVGEAEGGSSDDARRVEIIK